MDKTQRRKDGLRFKLLPDGHIRAYNAFTSDKRGISEMQIYPPPCCAPAVTTYPHTLTIVCNERFCNTLRKIIAGARN